MRTPEEIQAAIDNLRLQSAAISNPLMGAAAACVIDALLWASGQESGFEAALGLMAREVVN